MNQLTLRYEYDPCRFDTSIPRDDFGRSSAAVVTEQFSGKGGCFIQWQEVSEFGKSLSIYPISAEDPLSLRGGFEKGHGDDLIVRVEIGPKNSLGELTSAWKSLSTPSLGSESEPRSGQAIRRLRCSSVTLER